MSGQELIQSAAGFLEERSARHEVWLLLQQGDAGAGMLADLAAIRLIDAREQPQQCRLADAVGPDKPDALLGKELKTQILEQRASVKSAGQFRAT